jgi:hypothetical protein
MAPCAVAKDFGRDGSRSYKENLERTMQEDPLKVFEEVKEKISHLRGYL